MPRFGEQRLLRGALQRWHFRIFGVADPSHYLHHSYLVRGLREAQPLPRRILDAGCGSGDHSIWLARRYPDAHVLGVDINAESVERARTAAAGLRLRNASFQQMDLGVLALTGFDLVISVDVLEHLADQTKVLDLLANALNPGGVAFYHIPCRRPLPVLLERHLQDFRDWAEHEHVEDDLAPDEFISRVTRSGLEQISVRRTFGRWTGEAACSLFAVPYRNTPLNRFAQLTLAPVCRALAMCDPIAGGPRYAVAVTARKPAPGAGNRAVAS